MKKFQNPFLLSYIQSKIENRKTKMNIPMVTPKINIFTDTWLYCIKLEESQHWQHGEINRVKKKERKTQGNYTCQREKKKQVEATDVLKEEETGKKKNQIEGTDVTL